MQYVDARINLRVKVNKVQFPNGMVNTDLTGRITELSDKDSARVKLDIPWTHGGKRYPTLLVKYANMERIIKPSWETEKRWWHCGKGPITNDLFKKKEE